MSDGANTRPLIIKRKKVSGGGGHHGGAWKVAMKPFLSWFGAGFAPKVLGSGETLQFVILTCATRSPGHATRSGAWVTIGENHEQGAKPPARLKTIP
jgi:hypothetical protein